MVSVKLVRYAEASYDNVNVLYWQTYNGTEHFITLSVEWYEAGRLPADAMRLYAPAFPISVYTEFTNMDRMYNIPGGRVRCENETGDPFKPYGTPAE